MRMRTKARSRWVVRALAVAPAVALVAACSGSPKAVAPTGASSPSVAATTAAPSPSPTATTSPLSGRKGGVGTPIVVVKYDNTRAAQPHRGLTSADVVYVEPVEWGLTRIAAVFSTDIPAVAGPVRSARISDIDLLAQFGRVAFVFSGAQTRLLPKIFTADWLPVDDDAGAAGFHREDGTGRYMPTNLMADPQAILATVGASVAVTRDMGWVFDEQRPAGGTAASVVTARWPASSVQLRWNAQKAKYDVWMNGSPARDTDKPGVQRASTVIVQYVREHDSGYGDKFGGRTPMAETVGQGKGVLLRDGRAYKITWERPTATSPTAYNDAATGEPIAMAPGQVWVLLQAKDRKVTVE